MKAKLYTDGASKGNPGISAIGAVLITENSKRVDVSEFIGNSTNNKAEYEAIIRGLETAIENEVTDIHLYCDNLVVVNQIQGEYLIKSPDLRELFNKVHSLLPQFHNVQIEWIAREHNKQADRLANQAIKRYLNSPARRTVNEIF